MPVQEQRGGEGIALTHLQHDTIKRWVVSTMHRHFTPRKQVVTIIPEAGWASGPVWTT